MTERFLTLPEIHRAAKRLLPPGVYGYGAGGAETETTLRRNRHALQQLAIRQRVLVDVRIWVSNHGGRPLDSTQATIDMLPEIVEAVAGRAEIMVDGGFRRGTAVIKGLALGANVMAMGRTMLWGLTVGGATDVDRTLQILREELETSLRLCGQTSVRGLTPELVRQKNELPRT